HPIYKQAIVAAAADDAIATDAFSVGLPQPGAAGVLGSAYEAAQASTREILGETLIRRSAHARPALVAVPPAPRDDR
ncbi:MAG: hypothetical protein M3O70_14290, partial [Actinomycetota bacterium]|nr:hypothetical protein [Actinomycetota bacterium]